MLDNISPQHLKTAQMVAPLVLIQVLNKIDFTTDFNLNLARISYALMQLTLLAFWGYHFVMLSKTPVKSEAEGAEMVEVPAKIVMGQEQEPAKKLSLRDYDLAQIRAELQKILTSSLIVSGIHYKWGMVMPLCIQVCLLPLNLLQAPLFKVYAMGKEVTRPFPQESPFGGLMDEPKTEEKKEEKAEAKKELTEEVSTDAEEKEEAKDAAEKSEAKDAEEKSEAKKDK